MSIKGTDIAVKFAIERARRSKEAISIVQIGDNEYVLWRESNLEALPLVYKYFKVVKTIRIRLDDFR